MAWLKNLASALASVIGDFYAAVWGGFENGKKARLGKMQSNNRRSWPE